MIKSSRLNSNIIYYPKVRYNLTGISGPDNPIKTHGATYGNIIFGGIKLKQQMQIAGDDLYLNYDGILGIDFLRQYNATICIRDLSLRLLLPPWHELYEAHERQQFEKNVSIHKKIVNNELIYIAMNKPEAQPPKTNKHKKEYSTPKTQIKLTPETQIKSTAKTHKKIDGLDARINRLQLHHISENPSKKSVRIMPFSQKNFKILTDKPVVCKAKIFGDHVFSLDTIVNAEKSILTIYNTTYTP